MGLLLTLSAPSLELYSGALNILWFCFYSEFPPIANNEEREDYKHLFDKDHQEYKELQAELDQINKRLADVDRELNDLQEGSPQFLV